MRCLYFFFVLLCANTPAQAQSSTAKTEALRLFEAYKPSIEKNNDAVVQPPTAITGDLNGDGLEDCLLHFVLTPKEGGNAILGRQTAVYLNSEKGIKVAGAFPDVDFCYVPTRIEKGTVYADEYVCAPPYNEKKGVRTFQYSGGKIVLKQ